MRTSLLLLVLAACVVGCGGNGKTNVNTGDSLVPEQTMAALQSAVLTRDADLIRNQIDTQYLDDCENKAELVDAILDVIGTSGAIQFTVMPITNKSVNVNLGRAEFDGGFRIVVDDATPRSMTRSGHMMLRRDNGPWRLYGEQDCNN